MGIRLKIILAFILCFGVMASVSLVLLQRSMSESYDAIERGDVVDNMGRIEQSFEASALSLKSLTADWAVWNEMYRYVKKPDANWVQDNIGEASLAPANLAINMIFGNNGNLLTSSAIKIEGVYLDIYTPRNAPYFEFIKKNSHLAQCGIIKTDAHLMQICWAGIVHTDSLNDVVGTVVLGRLLDSAHVSKLREQTKLPFNLSTKTDMPAGLTAWPNFLTPGSIGSGEFWTSCDSDIYNIYYPVRDILKHNVALISLGMPRLVHRQGILLYQQVRQQLGWTALIMTTLLGLALHFMLVRRLHRFAKQLDMMENETTWNTRIDIGGKDELGLVAVNFNKLLTLIKIQMISMKELLEAKEAALKVIQVTQAKLILSEEAAVLGRQRVSNLLNNSGQGFLSFGNNLMIGTETSRACATMLGCDPTGGNAAQILSENADKANFFGEIITAVLAESEPVIQESMLSLLPAEIVRDDILLKAEYKILENKELMVVLTDITEERRLALLLQSERCRLELIVMAVSDTRNFFEAIDAFCEFTANSLPCWLQKTSSPQSIARALYREIHTHKGMLNQFSFIHTPQVLHEIETRLSDLVALGDTLSLQKIEASVSAQELQDSFEQDMAILASALGQTFLENRKIITLSVDQAWQLEQMATRLLQGDTIDTASSETRTLLNEMLHLRRVNLKKVLADFDSLVQQIATRLDKKVAPIEVVGGDDVWIDPQPYQKFLHALGHVFRNAVVHGLGTPESRWSEGKDEIGKITCRIDLSHNAIVLTIADDGDGIDLKSLRQRAVEAGLYGADAVHQVTDDNIAQLIFNDHISSNSSAVSTFSGRGIGLAAMMDETQKMGGTLVVKTMIGQGTQFLFTLPLINGIESLS
jgi:signal transduction histidine kinase